MAASDTFGPGLCLFEKQSLNMVFLPIAERELRVAARKSRTYWVRLHGAGVALAFVFWMIWIFGGITGQMLTGTFMLKFLSYVTFGVCIFTGAGRAADSISSEKREDTLGLLFLTSLKGYDIVLGKLLANSLQSLYSLLAVVPVFGVAVLMGGVSLGDLVRVPVSLLNSLLISLSLGLLASTLLKGQRAAMGLCAAMVLFLTAGIPGLVETLREEGWVDAMLLISLFSPTLAHEMSFAWTGGVAGNYFWLAIGVQVTIAAGILIVCSLILPHVWKIRPGSLKTVRLKERLESWVFGASGQRKAIRTAFLKRNPVFWLSARNRFGPWVTPFVIAIIIGSVIGSAVYSEMGRQAAVLATFLTMIVIDLFLKMRIATLASARLCEDRLAGALELILSTPLAVRELLRGEWMSLRRNLLWTHIVMILLSLIVFAAGRRLAGDTSMESYIIFGFFLVVSLGDFVTLGWVAMWQAMRVRHPAHAPGMAAIRVVLFPWITFILMMSIASEFPELHEAIGSNEPYSVLMIASGIWLTSSIAAVRAARRHLINDFRTAATDRFTLEERLSLSARLFRTLRTVKQAFSC